MCFCKLQERKCLKIYVCMCLSTFSIRKTIRKHTCTCRLEGGRVCEIRISTCILFLPLSINESSQRKSKIGGTQTLMMPASSVLCQMHESTTKRHSLKIVSASVFRLVEISPLIDGSSTTSAKYTFEIKKKDFTIAQVMSSKKTTSFFATAPHINTARVEVRNSGWSLHWRGSTRNIASNRS